MKDLKVTAKLADIQQKLIAPKNQRNNFGNYNYRSAEDILEALKPILGENCALVLSDELVNVGDRYYVKAKAKLIYEGESISVTAYAREASDRKGMDDSQITGSTSSYARKYALNGLFCIDDTKDADATNTHGKTTTTTKVSEPEISNTGHQYTKYIEKLYENKKINQVEYNNAMSNETYAKTILIRIKKEQENK